MPLGKKDISIFQRKIFAWWKHNRRDLPWRRTSDPYRIMVSEIMLQQTQVSRVIGKYREFVDAYPDVRALAGAPAADILRQWKGMGYNRRALYLKKTAQAILEHHNGIFPDTEPELLKLPGIGRYTARAILVFSFRKDVAMVDTNVRKIITYAFFGNIPQPERVIEEAAQQLVPKGKSWEWHQALMDYGALRLKDEIAQTMPDAKRVIRKQAVPFTQSARYFRGRILDLLRIQGVEENALLDQLADGYGRTGEEARILLDGLMKDGLIVRSGNGIMHLPE